MNIDKYLDSIIAKAGKDGAEGVIDRLINKCNKLQDTESKMHSTMHKFGDSEALEKYMDFSTKFSTGMKEAQKEASRLKQIIGNTKLNTVEFETMKTDIAELCKRFDTLAQSARLAKGISLNNDGISLNDIEDDDYFKIPNKIESIAKAYESKQMAAKAREQAAREEAKVQEQAARAAAEQRIKVDTLKRDWFTSNSTFSSVEFKEFDKKINQIKKGANSDDILSLNNEIAKLQAINERVKQLRESLKLAGKDTNLANNIKNEISAAKLHYDNIIKGISSKNLGVKLPSTFENDLTNQISGGKLSTIKDLCAQIGGVIAGIKGTVQSVVSVAVSAFQKIAGAIKTCVRALKTFASAIPKLLSLMSNFGNRVRSIFSKIGNILSNTFDTFLNNKYVASGLGVLQSIQTLNTVIGNELTESTINWANSLENAFGLSASGLIADLKQISGILYGLGMKSDETYNAGRNLLVVGSSLSNILGYSQEEVINKISSGLKGMTQSVDDLGLSVREAEMNSFLKELKEQGGIYSNIATSFSSLNEEQRVYIRYAALIKQYMDKYSVDTYVKSLDTITGRINILKNQLRTFINAVGQLFLQLFDRIIKPLILVVNYLIKGINYVAGLLNIDLGLSSNSNGGAFENIKNGAEGAADSVDGMTESLEEAKGALDELDNITNLNSSKGSASSGGSSFDYSLLMDLGEENNKQLADMMADINKETKNYFDGLKTHFPKLTDVLDKLSIIIDSLISGDALTLDEIVKLDGTESTFGKINDIALSINSIFKNICGIFGNLSEEFVNWIKDDGLSQIRDFIDRFDKFIKDNKETIIKILKKLGETIWTAILSFAEAMLKLLQFICDNESLVIGVLDTIIKALDFVGKHADDCAKVFLALTGFKLVLDVLGSIGSAVGTISGVALAGKLNQLCKIIGNGSTGTIGQVNTLTVSLSNKLGNALKGAVTNIKNFASSITGTLANAIATITGGASVGAAAIGTVAVAGAAVVTVEGTRQIIDMISDTIAGYKAADDYVKNIIERFGDKDENGAYYMEQVVYDKIVETLQKNKYNEEYNKAKETWGILSGLADTDIYMKGFDSSAREFANAMGDKIKNACIIVEDTSDIVNKKVSQLPNNLNTITDEVSVDVAVTMPSIKAPNVQLKSIRSISGYANGGIPKQGSLFFANEAGNTELVGNFGGYSGVANQNMIIKTMQQAISSSMYDAVKRAMSEQGNSTQIEVCRDGLFIGSEKSIRKLAEILNSANRNSRQNIANSSFGL